MDGRRWIAVIFTISISPHLSFIIINIFCSVVMISKVLSILSYVVIVHPSYCVYIIANTIVFQEEAGVPEEGEESCTKDQNLN